MLTAKQEKYVQNLVKGMSQREAYKNSYNASNMKDETIDSNACRLFADSKILTRYNELIERTAKKTIISVQERMELLTKIAQEEDVADRMKAVDLLNKMDGVYVQKIDGNINGKIEITDSDKELLANIKKRLDE